MWLGGLIVLLVAVVPHQDQPTQITTIPIWALFGPVSPGQVVTLSLDFQGAGSVLVEAPVATQ